jgi:hypothetical protein
MSLHCHTAARAVQGHIPVAPSPNTSPETVPCPALCAAPPHMAAAYAAAAAAAAARAAQERAEEEEERARLEAELAAERARLEAELAAERAILEAELAEQRALEEEEERRRIEEEALAERARCGPAGTPYHMPSHNMHQSRTSFQSRSRLTRRGVRLADVCMVAEGGPGSAC